VSVSIVPAVWRGPTATATDHVRACVLTRGGTTRRPILHRFANEDVSLGAWLLGLEVEHVDDRSLCCATPPGTQ